MGPIKVQRSGLWGGGVPIIGGIGGGKLSSFVLNSSVLQALVAFLLCSCRVQGQHNVDFTLEILSQMHSEGESVQTVLIYY